MNISISLKPVLVFLKKYTAMLPSIGILIGTLLLFVPVLLIGGSVKKDMTASVNTARQVQSELGDVPSRDKPQQVKLYMDKLEEDASKIELLALQSCQRDLITYDDVIFPKPVDSSAQVFHEFGSNYRMAIEEMLKNVKALDAPSDAEIRAKIGGTTADRTTGLGGRPLDGGYSGQRTVNVQDPRIDALCLSRAQEISVYAHPTAFPWYGFWEKYVFAGEGQALQDSWDAQVAFWIYQDIIDTIQKMNGTNSSVSESAVKRLLGVSFSGPVTLGQNQGMLGREYYSEQTAAGRDIPNYVTPLLSSNFMTTSPTGRVSNEELDVVHFAVSVLVDNRFVLAFQKELCSEKAHRFRKDFAESGEIVENARHNQITILQSDLKVIDPLAVDHQLYRYGKGAVMQLDLVCEYVFYRKSYDSIKPKPILQRLNVTETGTDAGTVTAPSRSFTGDGERSPFGT
jgi:hypothetical protein